MDENEDRISLLTELESVGGVLVLLIKAYTRDINFPVVVFTLTVAPGDKYSGT